MLVLCASQKTLYRAVNGDDPTMCLVQHLPVVASPVQHQSGLHVDHMSAVVSLSEHAHVLQA